MGIRLFPLSGEMVRDEILKKGYDATEATAFFWGNLTKNIQDTTKAGVMLDGGKRAAVGTFKASKDFARGDVICGGLCSVSVGCETVTCVLIWCPIPGKITAVATL